MFPRGRMYSDQVGQWSPRQRRHVHSVREGTPGGGSEEDETGGLDGPTSGASHIMYHDARGSRPRCRASDNMHGRIRQGSWVCRQSPAGRKASSRSSSRSSRGSSSKSSCYGLTRRLDTPGGGELLASHSRRAFEGRSPCRRRTSRGRPRHLPVCPEEQPGWHRRHRVRDNPTSATGPGDLGSGGDSNACVTLSPPPPPWGRRNRGGGVGIRGRGRPPFSAWGRFGGKRGRHSRSYSPSVDSDEDHRRSRSRERARRRRQVKWGLTTTNI